jgi:hemoglobin
VNGHGTGHGDASIFDSIGGATAVRAVVEELYLRLRDDPAIAEHFVDLDMAWVKAHQRAFVAAALGGPEVYTGREMAAAHRGLTITGRDFDALVRHLVDTLAGLGVPTPVIARIGARLAPLRADIVTAPPRALGA